jgi:hypothetical protein
MDKVQLKGNKITLAVFIIAVFSRLLPHAPNFTPLEAVALFAGTFLLNKYVKFLLPIVALYVVDLVLNNTILRGFYPEETGIVWYSDYMLWNFIAIVGIVLMGKYLTKKITLLSIGLTAVMASILFFTLSNIGVWVSSPLYTKDIQGLFTCFAAAVPFFRTSLISTLAFSYILIGGYAWIKERKLAVA